MSGGAVRTYTYDENGSGGSDDDGGGGSRRPRRRPIRRRPRPVVCVTKDRVFATFATTADLDFGVWRRRGNGIVKMEGKFKGGTPQDRGLIHCLCVDENCEHLFTCGKNITMWKISTLQFVRRFGSHLHRRYILGIDVYSNMLASVSTSGHIYIHNISTGAVMQCSQIRANMTCVSFSHCGSTIFTASGNKAIQWKVEDLSQIKTYDGHTKRMMSLAVSGNDELLYTCSIDGTVIIWNAISGAQLRTLTIKNSMIGSIALSPCENYLAIGSNLGPAVIHLDTGKRIFDISRDYGPVHKICFAPDGKHIIAATKAVPAKEYKVFNKDVDARYALLHCLRTIVPTRTKAMRAAFAASIAKYADVRLSNEGKAELSLFLKELIEREAERGVRNPLAVAYSTRNISEVRYLMCCVTQFF